MHVLETIDPEKFLLKSRANLFQIVLLTDSEHLSWVSNAFVNMEEETASGFKDMQTYTRDKIVKAYYNAEKEARGIRNGRLQIVEIHL
jgi:hypothetical protein